MITHHDFGIKNKMINIYSLNQNKPTGRHIECLFTINVYETKQFRQHGGLFTKFKRAFPPFFFSLLFPIKFFGGIDLN